MPAPNATNRTMWTGDNLPVLRGLNCGCIDLIYLDPPFNSNRDYAAPIGTEAAGAAFKDTWTLSDVDEAWHGEIAEREPSVYAAIDAAGIVHGPGMKSYLIMMAVRLLEMRRVLKPTGSLYLHCDTTASHYLKLLLDSVFDPDNFRGEVIWKRTSAHGDTKQGSKQHGRIHDVLLFYTKGSKWMEMARRKGTLWQREKGPLCRVVVATWPDGAERREATSRRVPINAFSSVERGPSGSVGRP